MYGWQLRILCAACLVAWAAWPAAAQGGLLGGLGGLGGAGGGEDMGFDLGALLNPQVLGALGGLGGLGSLVGGTTAAPGVSVVVSQPAMLIHGNSLYVAYEGKITKFDAETLQVQAQATYGTPPAVAGGGTALPAASLGPRLLQPDLPGMPTPPLVPGARPGTGP